MTFYLNDRIFNHVDGQALFSWGFYFTTNDHVNGRVCDHVCERAFNYEYERIFLIYDHDDRAHLL